ncbi:tyrosine-type recombinase/integrase [Bacillus haynesii]|uniref:tyrosine-type recombinase/integrase n=1 Tax=Bacillus TaxID=1386 RepID=UPI00228093D0|nr:MULTISPECIES: tyrosine-type recombinase/integrase [Bacillus]MCY7773469.1 tyrosine-type recombinase/integrase [Bacillus licheniformis]MCY7780181.1 tyrosine-type recombinase/integrase [Bacillus haynesii]MCY8021508.1 tyrosine-type recombinase/integrase [Bacillus licheniformis]MCY8530050.1 tyrosine-type recombinase/integrase [Bacillus licheniformis]MCY9266900.1 tyrosine-type recombinase/integrase [Bacillus licheniformis]
MKNVIPFQPSKSLIDEYAEAISGKADKTVEDYIRAVRQLTEWIARRPGSAGVFRPEQFTKTAMEMYLREMEDQGYSVRYRNKVKSAASSFANWLIEDKGQLQRNPTKGVAIPPEPLMAPRELTEDQRYVLRSLVERHADLRGQAIFALGYWAGLRVSDVSWQLMEDTHIGPKIGWIRTGHKGRKYREIDVVNEVRRSLAAYIESGRKHTSSPYVFTSQRADRLTESGIERWFRNLKSLATKDEWELIKDVAFHDLRHDFAHRARESGWTLEEVAYYLGHITTKGTPAISTTVRYTQVNRRHLRDKLKLIK